MAQITDSGTDSLPPPPITPEQAGAILQSLGLPLQNPQQGRDVPPTDTGTFNAPPPGSAEGYGNDPTTGNFQPPPNYFAAPADQRGASPDSSQTIRDFGNNFLGGLLSPATNIIADPGAYFRAPNATGAERTAGEQNAIGLFNFTRAGSGGAADARVAGELASGAKSAAGAAGESLAEAAPKAAGSFADAMGLRVPTAVSEGRRVATGGAKAGGLPGTVTTGMGALGQSLEDLRGRITNTRFGPTNGDKGTIQFDFNGKTYSAPEPTEIMFGQNPEFDTRIAGRALLDKTATPIGDAAPAAAQKAGGAADGARFTVRQTGPNTHVVVTPQGTNGEIFSTTNGFKGDPKAAAEARAAELNAKYGTAAPKAAPTIADASAAFNQAAGTPPVADLIQQGAKDFSRQTQQAVRQSLRGERDLTPAETATLNTEAKTIMQTRGIPPTPENVSALADAVRAKQQASNAASRPFRNPTPAEAALEKNAATARKAVSGAVTPASQIEGGLTARIGGRGSLGVDEGAGPMGAQNVATRQLAKEADIRAGRAMASDVIPGSPQALDSLGDSGPVGKPEGPKVNPEGLRITQPSPRIPGEVSSPSKWDTFLSAWNLPKALKAAFDLSAPFRQGVLLAAGHPGDFIGAFKPMLQAAKDSKFAAALDAEIRSVDRPGLYLAPIDGAALGAREEAFMSNFANKIPGMSASNRAYTTFLNKLRADVYDHTLAGWTAGGKFVNPLDTIGLANVVNHFTGRGDLPNAVKDLTPVLNGMFFSPRFTISRFQSVGDALGVLKSRDSLAAQLAAKDMVKFIGAGLGVIALAKMAGAKVEDDPRSSAFGKMRFGDTSIELWGGIQPLARYTAQLITGQSKPIAGAHAGEVINAARIDTLTRFAQSKLSPSSGTALGVLKGPTTNAPPGSIGRNFIGQNFSATDLVDPTPGANNSLITPLGWSDVADAVTADRMGGGSGVTGALLGSTSLLGAGVQTINRTSPNRDGLGRIDDGALPATPVTDAWDKAHALNPSVVGALTPSGRSIDMGNGKPPIVLDDKETDALRVFTGNARSTIIGQVVSSPTFQNANPAQQEKMLVGAKIAADRQGKIQFALDHAKTATNDMGMVRAVTIGLHAATTTSSKMNFVAQLSQQNTLTDVAHNALDDLRTQPDPLKANYQPTVNEYLKGNDLIQRYIAAPAFKAGTPQDWTEAARHGTALHATYLTLQREAQQASTAQKKVAVEQLPDYKNYIHDYNTARTSTGRPVSAFITKTGTIDPNMVTPQRLAIMKDPVFNHFLSVAKARDPYSIKGTN